MESRVVKRRGKPNRGGGRFNRGRGRGRGRGFQPQQQPEPSRGQHHGHGGRKGGADFMADYEDGLSDDDYDYGGEGFTVTAAAGSGSRGASGSRGGSAGFDRGGGRGGQSQGRGVGRGMFPRRNPVKVTMQHLQMSTDNQEMVKGMLRDLHGEDIELNEEDCYNELDHRAENQYWIVDQMKIEDTVINDPTQWLDGYDYTGDVTVTSLAVNKLERYGFHKSKATEALQVCDNDIGLALEYLLAQCFDLNQSAESTELEDHILEQREDEMMALTHSLTLTLFDT